MYTVVASPSYILPRCVKTRATEDEHCVLWCTHISYNICDPIPLDNLKNHTALPYITEYNKTILLLQYCKLSRDENKSAEEWMGHLKIKAKECNYEMHARQSKEPFTSGINDKMMTAEIIKGLTTMQKTSDIMRKQVLSWANSIRV